MTTLTRFGKPKDMQRGKLYKAEDKAFRADPGEKLPTTRDIERYIRKTIGARATLVRRYGIAADFLQWPCEVADGRGRRRACAIGTKEISMPLWSRTEWIVLHEIAHIIHDRLRYTSCRSVSTGIRVPVTGERVEELKGGAAHGWQFAAIYIDLMHFCRGAEYAERLKAEFKAGKVRFRAPRTRVMPPGYVPFKKKVPVTDETAMDAIEGRKAA